MYMEILPVSDRRACHYTTSMRNSLCSSENCTPVEGRLLSVKDRMPSAAVINALVVWANDQLIPLGKMH